MRRSLIAIGLVSSGAWACSSDDASTAAPAATTDASVDGGGQPADEGGAGQGGGAGTDTGTGTGGTTGPIYDMYVPDPCDGKTQRALPYAIAQDFIYADIIPVLSASAPQTRYWQIANPDCDRATFPEAGPPEIMDDAGASDAAMDTDADLDADLDAADADLDAAEASAPAPACYEFYYNPDACTNDGHGPNCWAGVIFQVSPKNETDAKSDPGVCIALGAAKIQFSARSSRDGARIKFGAIRPGVGSTEYWLDVTTEWQSYTIDIPSDYNFSSNVYGVWNGFSAVAEPLDHAGGTYLLIKDVVWLGE